MEAEAGNVNLQPGGVHRLLPAVLPVLLIAIGYIDPGKWVVTIEGGARFGFDLVIPMLLFNSAAILCQYLSARIGIVTGKDLAQVQFVCFYRLCLLQWYFLMLWLNVLIAILVPSKHKKFNLILFSLF